MSWLRGYCHFLAALGELCLAVDGQKAFDCSAHLLFEKVETPHNSFAASRRDGSDAPSVLWGPWPRLTLDSPADFGRR